MSRDPTPRPDFSDAMRQLKHVITQSGDALITEGSVSPDYELLGLCSEALHHLAHAQKCRDARRVGAWRQEQGVEAQQAAWDQDQRLCDESIERDRRGRPPLDQIRKIKAQTAAGIYAKALVVAASRTGAERLARSLAQDFLDCPGLRSALWPAGSEGVS